MQQSLVETFLRHYKVVYARTPEYETSAYQIRYQVYCEELGYENSWAFNDGCEHDDFDSCSDQALLIHIPSGEAVGCSRLVGARGLPASGLFPLEKHFAGSLDSSRLNLEKIPKMMVGEFSRLAVLPKFRQAKMEPNYGDQRTPYSLISLGLFVCSLSMLILTSLGYGVAIMEPRLARRLRWHGIHFHPFGPVIDFRGKRAPYYITRRAILVDLPEEVEQLRRAVTRQLRESSREAFLAKTKSYAKSYQDVPAM